MRIGLAAAFASVALCFACSGARPQPHGPPPEYEEPPVPVWPPAGADAGATASDAATPPPKSP